MYFGRAGRQIMTISALKNKMDGETFRVRGHATFCTYGWKLKTTIITPKTKKIGTSSELKYLMLAPNSRSQTWLSRHTQGKWLKIKNLLNALLNIHILFLRKFLRESKEEECPTTLNSPLSYIHVAKHNNDIQEPFYSGALLHLQI